MILFLFRFFMQVCLFIVTTILQLIGACILFVYIPLHYKKATAGILSSIKLTVFLRWFDCADLYQDFNRNPVTYMATVWPQGWWAVYVWLAWRNPLNYLNYKYLAFPWDVTSKIESNSNFKVGDTTSDHEGYLYTQVYTLNRYYYEYQYVKKWTNNVCFYFRMGWKISNPSDNKQGDLQQQVFTISPIKSYSGQ